MAGYAQMFALPLVGWTMLSAGGYTISLVSSVHVPRLSPSIQRCSR
jgi:cytochrome b561